MEVCGCLQVEEITLNATIVKRSDGGRMWYSNTKLAASNVINISRSDSKSEAVKACMSNFIMPLHTFARSGLLLHLRASTPQDAAAVTACRPTQ